MYVDDGGHGNNSSNFSILAFLSDINNDINSSLLKNVFIAKSWAATFLQRWIYKLLKLMLFSFSFIFIMLSSKYNIHTCIHRIEVNLIFIPICLVDRYVLFLTSNIPKRGRYINAISVPVSFDNIRLSLFENWIFFSWKKYMLYILGWYLWIF